MAFFGRSMVRNMGVARDLGYLTIPGDCLVASDQLNDLPDDQVVLVCTGSQGEPMAALSRIANNDHQIKIGPGDTVVLASSLIPGNENAVGRVINGLTRLGAKVVHKGNAMVHVSGHAAAGELLYCYNIVKPRNVMPVHGEPRHLKANAELALSTGVPAERIMLTLDGGVIDLVDGRASVVGAVPCGYVYVDGASVGDLTESSLKDRRVLGAEGFITCFVVVDSVDGKVTAGPEIQARGFVEDDAAFDAVMPEAQAGDRGRAARRQHRPVRAAADRAPRARPLGQRPAPPASDDRARRRRGLAAPESHGRRRQSLRRTGGSPWCRAVRRPGQRRRRRSARMPSVIATRPVIASAGLHNGRASLVAPRVPIPKDDHGGDHEERAPRQAPGARPTVGGARVGPPPGLGRWPRSAPTASACRRRPPR